jgi:hypothetical protein
MLKPLTTGIFFEFCDDTTGDRFINSAASKTIVIASTAGQQTGLARWGFVTEIGPDVVNVSTGDFILVEPGMWTQHFINRGVRTWKTNEEKVMAISDSPGTVY